MNNYQKMSNREFSDVLADLAMQLERDAVSREQVTMALREASVRVRSDQENEFPLFVWPTLW